MGQKAHRQASCIVIQTINMKTSVVLAVLCFIGLSQALTHDEIKEYGRQGEKAVKCIIENHGEIEDVEDLVEKLETISADNGKIEMVEKKIKGFLKAIGIEVDESKGFFGLSVDIYKGVAQAYNEGKDDDVLAFMEGLVSVVPPEGWEAVGKVWMGFLKKENLGACGPEKRGINLSERKDMSALYNLLRQMINKKK